MASSRRRSKQGRAASCEVRPASSGRSIGSWPCARPPTPRWRWRVSPRNLTTGREIRSRSSSTSSCITWSAEDGEHVGLCAEFPSLSWLAANPGDALSGIQRLVADCVDDMRANGEPVPEPMADRPYSIAIKRRSPACGHGRGVDHVDGRHGVGDSVRNSRPSSSTRSRTASLAGIPGSSALWARIASRHLCPRSTEWTRKSWRSGLMTDMAVDFRRRLRSEVLIRRPPRRWPTPPRAAPPSRFPCRPFRLPGSRSGVSSCGADPPRTL